MIPGLVEKLEESPFLFDGFCKACGGRVIGETGEDFDNCICDNIIMELRR
jgi:hypothetical protein